MAYNNIYFPPIIPTYSEAFYNDSDYIKIKFAMSLQNIPTDFKPNENSTRFGWAKVTIRNSASNSSVVPKIDGCQDALLCPVDFLEGIIKIPFSAAKMDSLVSYVSNSKSAYIREDNFYIIQAAFVCKNSQSVYPTVLSNIIVDNNTKGGVLKADIPYENFTEWSSATLAFCSKRPVISLTGFNNSNEFVSSTVGVGLSDFIANIELSSSDSLSNFWITLKNGVNIVYNSGTLTATNANQLKHKIRFNYKYNTNYILNFGFLTKNNLVFSSGNYIINVVEPVIDEEKAFKIYSDNENGRFIISAKFNSGNKSVIVRRSCSKDNYATLEQIYNNLNFSDTNFVYADNTIESGIFYKYLILCDNKYYAPVNGQDKVMMILEYSSLIGDDGRQLNLKFNEQLSGYKQNIVETKIDTIGSKYPFIRRSGNINYQTFNLSFTISSEEDPDNLLQADFSDVYDEEISTSYLQYIESHRLPKVNDLKERLFRDKVLEFLNDGKPKLFRSRTEGNILIYLTGVNVSPMQQLGRMISSVSATAYEIGDEFDFTILQENSIPSKQTLDVTEDYLNDVYYQDGIGSIMTNHSNIPWSFIEGAATRKHI